ncbi:hypothetical protein DET47_101125 [Shewanella putrefaciens]|nr:hypothetical protein DET47_101125 [Shewanella putrefaciens]
MLPRNVTTISRMPIYGIMKIKSYLAMVMVYGVILIGIGRYNCG